MSSQWSVIDRAVLELAENRDLVETTAHEYIVGYLCKALAERGAGVEMNMLPTSLEASRGEALRKLREAVKAANPGHRDLVSELIAERTAEAQHE